MLASETPDLHAQERVHAQKRGYEQPSGLDIEPFSLLHQTLPPRLPAWLPSLLRRRGRYHSRTIISYTACFDHYLSRHITHILTLTTRHSIFVLLGPNNAHQVALSDVVCAWIWCLSYHCGFVEPVMRGSHQGKSATCSQQCTGCGDNKCIPFYHLCALMWCF